MATFDKPIATNQGIALLKATVDGSDSITFTKTVFSSDDYSQTSDSSIANLTNVQSVDLTVQPQAFQDVNGNTKVRAVGYNNSVTQAFYIKTYALYAKNKAGNEILFAVASSQTADFVPAFNNAQLTQIAYTFTFAIDQTQNITLSDQHEITVTQADLAGINNAVNSNASSLTAQQTSYAGSVSSTISSNANSLQAYISSAANSMQTALTTNSSNNSSYVSSATNSLTSYVASQVASMQSAVSSNATNITANSNAISSNATNISNLQSNIATNSSAISSNANSASSAVGSLQTSINSNSSAISSNAVNIANNSNAISSNANLTSQAVTQINNNISNIQNNVNNLSNNTYVAQPSLQSGVDLNNVTNTGLYPFWGLQFTNDPYPGQVHWGTLRVTNYGGVICQEHMTYDGIMYRTWSGGSGWRNWEKLGG
ncbi:pyocin knob domain-containing protein [Apilactobacillus nanyangensis]|uniref:pyocin knob domain-containing protein n=1 Tax=Apilactobacillus nanyangensis TaxID=2799579 RepID=UPI001940E55E|nr:pyocin knob domain-containing protein [Apilactobacillus nanyangensis]